MHRLVLVLVLGMVAIICILLTAAAAEPAAGTLVYVAGSTKKVCQLTGDVDRSTGRPTLSETGKRFGVFGTDLGSSFEYDGRLFFLFGDTWGRPGDRDVVAWTRSKTPKDIVLDFDKAPDGKWLPLTVPGVAQSAFEVPSGGISAGSKIYVAVTTDWSPETGRMGRSVLAVALRNGQSFQALYDLSTTKFINVSFWSSGGWIYLFGSGAYRNSDVYLARIRPSDLADRSRLLYFHGFNLKGLPQWSPREPDAVPLFHHAVVGEFSVAYCSSVRRYVLLYSAPHPRGIVLRSAPSPWGPWSDSQVIFDPWRDHGYGVFMHIPTTFQAAKRDAVSDPGHETVWGGEYGPYVMARFTTGGRQGCRLFYTMSTWNPYAVVVMQTDLKLAAGKSRPAASWMHQVGHLPRIPNDLSQARQHHADKHGGPGDSQPPFPG